LLFNWAIKRGGMTTNPAIVVELIKAAADAKEANRPWIPEELETVLQEAPPELRPGSALDAYVGMREGDVILATWSIYDGQTIAYQPAKTRRARTLVQVRAHARLREVLDETPRRGLLIVLGARGGPFAQDGFRARFFALLRRLEAEGKIGPDLPFHGLRHTLGTLLAEAGCDPPTIAAVLGHRTTAMAEHYSRRARRGELADAAIMRLEEIRREQAKE
jgi:integrase